MITSTRTKQDLSEILRDIYLLYVDCALKVRYFYNDECGCFI